MFWCNEVGYQGRDPDAKINDITEKQPGRFLTTQEVTMEIKGEEKPAMVAEWLSMVVTA